MSLGTFEILQIRIEGITGYIQYSKKHGVIIF